MSRSLWDTLINGRGAPRIPVRLPSRKAMKQASKGAPGHLVALPDTEPVLAGIKGFLALFRAIPRSQFRWDFAYLECVSTDVD